MMSGSKFITSRSATVHSTSSDTTFLPEPGTTTEGMVRENSPERGFLVVEANGYSYLNLFGNMPRTPGGHMCLFQPGVKVRFKVERGIKRDFANDTQLTGGPFEIAERERSTVIEKKSIYGVLERECGCTLFTHKDAFYNWDEVKVGDVIEHSVQWDSQRQKYKAVDAVVVDPKSAFEYIYRTWDPEELL